MKLTSLLKYKVLAAAGTLALLGGLHTAQAQILVFAAPASGANATSQDPSSIASNITVDGLQRIQDGTVGGNVLFKTSTAAWGQTHWGSPGTSNSYQGTRSDSGFVFTVTAAAGYTFDLTSVTFLHRATSAGPGTVGIKVGTTEFIGTGTSASTTVGTYNSGALGLTNLTTATFIAQGWDSGGTGNGEFQMNDLQVFGSVNSSGPPPTNNNSVLSVPATSTFGRVMEGSSQTVTVSNTGDATTFNASADGGFSPAATGSVTADGTSGLAVNVGATLGNRSGTLTVENTAVDSAAAGQGSDQAPITSALSATVVQDRVLDTGSVASTTNGGIDVGRQMLGTVTGTHTVTSTGADAENTRVTFSETASNTFGGYSATGLTEARATNADGVDVVLDGSTNMNIAYEFDFTQTGARDNDSQFILFNTGNGISGEGLAGETVLGGQPNSGQLRVYIQNATIVDNREVDATGVDLGSVLVGATTGAQTTTLSTTGDDDNFTRVTVDGTSATNGGVTIAAGSAQEFTDDADTTTRSLTGNFATSGVKNVDVNFNVSGEGLASETVNAVTVSATANVYQAADLTANTASTLGDGDSITVANADTTDGGQRAAAEIVSRSVTGAGWDVTGLNTGTTISQDSDVSGTASFNAAASGLLNGATATGSLMLGFQHANLSIQGTAVNDLGTATWNFEAEVSGNNSGLGEVALANGTGFSGLGIERGGGGTASLLGGAASSNTTVEMELSATPVGSGVSANDDALGDYLKLTGTGSDTFVLSMSYTGTPDTAVIQWWNAGSWVNAVDGNTTGTPNFLGDVAFDSATHLSLGNHGYDSNTNTAWAVLNHNSDFVAAIPEPGSILLVMIALGALGLYHKRRR